MNGVYVLRSDCTLMKYTPASEDFEPVFTFCSTIHRFDATVFSSREAAQQAIDLCGWKTSYKLIIIEF